MYDAKEHLNYSSHMMYYLHNVFDKKHIDKENRQSQIYL